MFELTVVGLDRWVPLRLDADLDTYAEELAREWPQTPGIEDLAAGLCGLLRNMLSGQEEVEDDGVVLLAAWVFSASSTELDPLTVANLRAVPLEPHDATPETYAAGLYDGEELYEPATTVQLDTASGPAWAVRFRPVLRIEGEREVHEQNVVFWLRPEQGFAAVISAYCADLLLARDVPVALGQLAEGVAGL